MSLLASSGDNNTATDVNEDSKRKIIDETAVSRNDASTNVNKNKKLKTELQTVVDIAGEILLSLLPENKIKEFPDPPMRRLNLVQQIFERNNKIIDEIEKNENQVNAELLYELNGNIHEIVQIYSGLEKA